jgi:hypothetical protein
MCDVSSQKIKSRCPKASTERAKGEIPRRTFAERNSTHKERTIWRMADPHIHVMITMYHVVTDAEKMGVHDSV